MDLSQLPSDTPIAFVPENPKQSGSQTWHRYEAYKSSTSLGQARESGATSADLKAAAASGHMKVGEAAKVHRLSALKRVLGSPASTEKTPGKKNARTDDGIEADETEGAAGPVKAEVPTPVGPTKLDFSGHAGSSGDHGERVLEALAALSSKTDALNTKIDALSINAATKNDVATLKAEMEASTRTAIAEAVGPLETRVEALGATMASTGTSATTANSPDLSRVMERLNKLDPALKSITAIGFDVMDLQDRMRTLRQFMNEHFKDIKFTAVETILKGPYNHRKATKVSYIEFSSRHDANVVLRGIESKGRSLTDSSGTPLRFARAKTHLQLSRNYALKKAKDLVEKHAASENKVVSMNWKNRAVEVDGKDVFTQEKNDMAGKSMQPFVDISLE